MASLYLLGTGAAVTDPHRTTTMLAVSNKSGFLAVDCGGDLVQRLLAAGLDPLRLSALLLTHEHPDHTSGFPLLMEKLWLHGRRRPVSVYGPESALTQARSVFSTYDTSRWSGLPDIEWSPVPLEKDSAVLSEWGWEVVASPGDHGVPVLGFRFTSTDDGKVVTYSADTAPSRSIVSLAHHSDLLVHEATGAREGHTSAPQAARLALDSDVRRLLLVHLPPSAELEIAEAQSIFPNTEAGTELGTYLL